MNGPLDAEAQDFEAWNRSWDRVSTARAIGRALLCGALGGAVTAALVSASWSAALVSIAAAAAIGAALSQRPWPVLLSGAAFSQRPLDCDCEFCRASGVDADASTRTDDRPAP